MAYPNQVTVWLGGPAVIGVKEEKSAKRSLAVVLGEYNLWMVSVLKTFASSTPLPAQQAN